MDQSQSSHKKTIAEIIKQFEDVAIKLDCSWTSNHLIKNLPASASAKSISNAVEHTNGKLPSDYIEFLKLHNGWKGFLNFYDFMAAEDFARRATEDFIKDDFLLIVKNTYKAFLKSAPMNEKPFLERALIFGLSLDCEILLFFDTEVVGKNGHFKVYGFHEKKGLSTPYEDFTTFLQFFMMYFQKQIADKSQKPTDSIPKV